MHFVSWYKSLKCHSCLCLYDSWLVTCHHCQQHRSFFQFICQEIIFFYLIPVVSLLERLPRRLARNLPMRRRLKSSSSRMTTAATRVISVFFLLIVSSALDVSCDDKVQDAIKKSSSLSVTSSATDKKLVQESSLKSLISSSADLKADATGHHGGHSWDHGGQHGSHGHHSKHGGDWHW